LQCLNSLDKEMLVKDAKVAHLSNWMVVRDATLAQKLQECCGTDNVPLNLRVRYSGNETV